MFYLISICTNSIFFDKERISVEHFIQTEEKEREKKNKMRNTFGSMQKLCTGTNLKYVVVLVSPVKDIIIVSNDFDKNKLYRVHVGTIKLK